MIYSTLQERPRLSHLLLVLVLVAWFSEMLLLHSEVIPGKYDWMFGCLLFATILAWMGVAAQIGAATPVDSTMMRYAYGALLVFPLIVAASLTAVEFLYPDYDDFPSFFEPSLGLILWAWMALAGLVGATAPPGTSAWAYVSLVIAPLLMGIAMVIFLLATVIPWPGREGWWDHIEYPLLGSYGLAVFLLSRASLSRLTWTGRFRSNLLFIPVAVFTLVMTILTPWAYVWIFGANLKTTLLFVLVILAPFGMITLRDLRGEQCRERQLRHAKVAVAALSTAMASYWVAVLPPFAAGILLNTPWWLVFLPLTAGLIVSVPAGYLISEMRHPHRNVLVAAIGPGLLMLMIMCFYWLEVLDKGF